MGQDTVWAGILWRNTMKNQPGTMKQKRYTRGVTNDRGGGRGRNEQNKQKRYTLGVTTDLGGGLGRNKQNKQKRYTRGVTTDLLDV